MIFVECKPDRTLTQFLIENFPAEIVHSGNKPGVCKKLKKNQNCIGLIDEDPNSVQPSYIDNLELEYDLEQFEIRVLKDQTNNNRLIILKPRLEEWIIATTRNCNIEMEPFGLDSNPHHLHSIINTSLDLFMELIVFLKDVIRAQSVLLLKRLLEGETL